MIYFILYLFYLCHLLLIDGWGAIIFGRDFARYCWWVILGFKHRALWVAFISNLSWRNLRYYSVKHGKLILSVITIQWTCRLTILFINNTQKVLKLTIRLFRILLLLIFHIFVKILMSKLHHSNLLVRHKLLFLMSFVIWLLVWLRLTIGLLMALLGWLLLTSLLVERIIAKDFVLFVFLEGILYC